MDLSEAVVIVTGAAAGIGAVLVQEFADRGSVVIAADIAHDGAAATPARVRPVVADVCRAEGRAAILAAAQAAGGPDVLVNNAGGWGNSRHQYPLATDDEWAAVIELNLIAPMRLTQLCQPAMTLKRPPSDGVSPARTAAVVNIASSAGFDQGSYASPEYGAAKAGLIRFSTSVADWADRYGIRVNCLVPGWIGLDRAVNEYQSLPAERRAVTPPLIPPAEVATAVARLATDESLAGRILVLDGGRSAELVTG